MVEIILTALTPAGEAAIMKYHNEKLGVVARLRMRREGVSSTRKILAENPLIHETIIKVAGASLYTLNARFKDWSERNKLLYESKMLDYGATAEDYRIEVRR